MNKIIPYNPFVYNSDGAFVTPNNDIIFTHDTHENFAKDYCYGTDYDKLYILNLKNKTNIDIFSSSKLSKEELRLYKLWLKENEFNNKKSYSDFMFFVLGFDKIQTKLKKTITTTNCEPHIKFYNYYLMDWYIEQHSPIKYVDEVSEFKYMRNNYIINSYRDSEAENEINEIKAKILKKDRPYFFK